MLQMLTLGFLKMVGGTWEAPQYKKIRKLPLVPKETEIDQLIAGSKFHTWQYFCNYSKKLVQDAEKLDTKLG